VHDRDFDPFEKFLELSIIHVVKADAADEET